MPIAKVMFPLRCCIFRLFDYILGGKQCYRFLTEKRDKKMNIFLRVCCVWKLHSLIPFSYNIFIRSFRNIMYACQARCSPNAL